MQIVAFTSMLGLTLSFSVIYIFTSELFPTTFRGLGFGVTNIGARLGGILAPYIVELQFFGKRTPSIIFGILALIGGIASLVFLPETKGCDTLETLEDMKRLYGSGEDDGGVGGKMCRWCCGGGGGGSSDDTNIGGKTYGTMYNIVEDDGNKEEDDYVD